MIIAFDDGRGALDQIAVEIFTALLWTIRRMMSSRSARAAKLVEAFRLFPAGKPLIRLSAPPRRLVTKTHNLGLLKCVE